VHSPLRGFWWSHVGWILCDKYNDTEFDRIRDFAKYPELRFLNRYDFIAPWTLAIASFLIAGLPGLFTGFFLSTVFLWHNTFMINSLAHVFGRRRYATEDTSRNNALLALATFGEGWHNNHHAYQASSRNGFFWWEIDVTYYVLKGLSWLHVVRDLKVPSAEVKYGNWVRDGSFDIGMFKANWAKAAAAVANTQTSIGDRVRERKASAGEAIVHGRCSPGQEAGARALRRRIVAVGRRTGPDQSARRAQHRSDRRLNRVAFSR
jgi:stearoyl-CoA desaturase (delta-9 desaturase)